MTQPVFIIGFNKSGKTLLKNILVTHPNIIGYPSEANDLWHPNLYPWHKSSLSVPPIWMEPATFVKHSQAEWTEGHRATIRARLGAYFRLSRKQTLLVDSAMIAFMVPALLELFPGARFIHFHRDGRVCSFITAKKEHAKIIRQKAAYTKGGYYFEDFEDLVLKFSLYWTATISEVEKIKFEVEAIGPHNLMELSYEQFCLAPTDNIERICAFLKLPFVQLGVAHVQDANERVLAAMPPDTMQTIVEAIGPTLEARGYNSHSTMARLKPD